MKFLSNLAVALVLTFTVYFSAEAQNLRQRQLMDDNWRFYLNTNGNSTVTGGTPVAQWVWIADDNAPNDADTMANPNLNVSTWTNVAIGTDVFKGRIGY